MPLLVPSRGNLLAYPAGVTPGFDPSHVASQGIAPGVGLSAVARGNSFVNLLSGSAGTPNTTTAGVTGLGPVVNFTGSSNGVNFSGFPSTTYSNLTMAAIGYLSTTSGNTFSFCIGTGASGQGLYLAAGGYFSLGNWGGTNLSASVQGRVGPCLMVASINGASVCNVMLVYLDTGEVLTATSAGVAAYTASNGVASIGNSNYGSGYDAWNGNIAAAMFSPVYMSMQQLLQWAQDPWAFWYPKAAVTKLALSGTTYPWTVSVACTTAVTSARNTAKQIAINCTTSMSMVKQIAKSVAIGCTTSMSLLKQVGKTVAIACTTSVNPVSAIKVILVTISVACGSLVSLTKSTTKQISISCISAISLLKATTKTMAIGCVSSVSMFRQIAKSMDITSITSTLVSAIKNSGTAYFVTVAVSCSTTVTGAATSIIAAVRKWVSANQPSNTWTTDPAQQIPAPVTE